VPSLQDQIKELIGGLNAGPLIGVDIGSHSVKVCEMSGSKNSWKLEKFAMVKLSEAAIIEDEIQRPEEVLQAIDEAFKTAGIKSKAVVVGLYGQNTMTKRMSAPDGTNEEVQDHLLWEVEQYIPFGAEESEVDFAVIGENESGGKDAVVVAARTEVVERFEKLLIEAKYQVKGVSLNVIALSNLFEATAVAQNPDLDEGTIILDYGAQSIKIIIYKGGGPIFTKEIPVGGSFITEEIQRQMAVSYEDAENLKTIGDDNGNLPEEILSIIQSQLEGQISELKKNLNFYISAGSAEQVQNCFLLGGGAKMPLLKDMIEQSIGMEVQFFNPFDYGLKCAAKSLAGELDTIGSVGCVAMGLVMR